MTDLLVPGRHRRLWQEWGAQPREGGCAFAVWAPRARQVRVVGDFCGWGAYDGVPMLGPGPGGVWRVDVPGVTPGQRYKYRIQGADGVWRDRADPMARAAELPPHNCSVVWRSRYEWGDAAWLADRPATLGGPMSVYEVHLGSWRPGLSYVALAEELVAYVRDLGFTHVELLPVMEHPYGGSWGYQVTGYYAPTARFGTPDEFRYLVDRLHRAGIGVILDWVPAHFPRDGWALARFDGAPLYEPADPRQAEHPDWGSLVFDYGRPEVREFLIDNARYWCEEFHADGLRVDAVASMLYLDYSRRPGEWTPNAFGGRENLAATGFLRELTSTIRSEFPGVVTIAENSASWPGVTSPVSGPAGPGSGGPGRSAPGSAGLGFDLAWNLGWMHDTLAYLSRDPVHRQHHHAGLTWPSVYAFDERFLLPISHDEVVHGKLSLSAKLPGDRWQRFAGLRGLLAYMWSFPGTKLLFMGCELAEEREWSEQRGLDWSRRTDPHVTGVRDLLRDLNAHYRASRAMWSRDGSAAGFQWISYDDAAGNVLAYLRWGDDGSVLACVVNFAGRAHREYRIGLPFPGRWNEIVNTDAACYGGAGVGNLGSVYAVGPAMLDMPVSAAVQIGPYAAVWLRPA